MLNQVIFCLSCQLMFMVSRLISDNVYRHIKLTEVMVSVILKYFRSENIFRYTTGLSVLYCDERTLCAMHVHQLTAIFAIQIRYGHNGSIKRCLYKLTY